MQSAGVSGVGQVAQMPALSTEIFAHSAYSVKAARGGRVRAAEQKKKPPDHSSDSHSHSTVRPCRVQTSRPVGSPKPLVCEHQPMSE